MTVIKPPLDLLPDKLSRLRVLSASIGNILSPCHALPGFLCRLSSLGYSLLWQRARPRACQDWTCWCKVTLLCQLLQNSPYDLQSQWWKGRGGRTNLQALPACTAAIPPRSPRALGACPFPPSPHQSLLRASTTLKSPSSEFCSAGQEQGSGELCSNECGWGRASLEERGLSKQPGRDR